MDSVEKCYGVTRDLPALQYGTFTTHGRRSFIANPKTLPIPGKL